MKRVLITGVGGFVGRHLASLLYNDGYDVYGLETRPMRLPYSSVFEGDILNKDSLRSIYKLVRPHIICHLAAIAHTRVDPETTMLVNAVGTNNVLEALDVLHNDPTVLLVGSIDEIGTPLYDRRVIDESTPLQPVTPYGKSKELAWQYAQLHIARGRKIMSVSPTNHFGYGQRPGFLGPDVAQQIAQIEYLLTRGGSPERDIHTGFLGDRKAFLAVGDVVRAYKLLIERGIPGERYLLGSPRQLTMEELVNMIMGRYLFGATHPLKLVVSGTPRSPINHAMIDYSKITQHTSWRPEIPLESAAEDLLKSYRDQY